MQLEGGHRQGNALDSLFWNQHQRGNLHQGTWRVRGEARRRQKGAVSGLGRENGG